MKKYSLIILSFLLFVIVSCKEDEKGPLIKEGDIPAAVTNVKVENLPGGAKITYNLPNDPNLLYVIASYTNDNGVIVQNKASVFKTFVMLEGFTQEKEYIVNLQTVNRSENYSTEMRVKVNPLEPPIHEVFRSLKVNETSGGAHVSLKNELEKEYVIYSLLRDSTTGNWFEQDRLYTSSPEREFSVRGPNNTSLDSVPTDFAFYLTDRWRTVSDTLFVNITPIYEELVDKSLWKDANLEDDFNNPLYGPLSELWTPGPLTYFFQSEKGLDGITVPNWVTIDLGAKYKLGRFKINGISHGTVWIYQSSAVRFFEVFGSNIPTTDWAEWTSLGEFEYTKPSGLPVGQLSEDDLAYNAEGPDFILKQVGEGFRYFRFVNIQTWGQVTNFSALEFTLWGIPN